MKKFIKTGSIVAGLIIVMLIAVVLLAKLLITPERVRNTVLPIAAKNLQREVALGEIEVSLFSGIILHDLIIKEPDGSENFVTAEEVALRYQFWPLFFMEVVVDEIRLEGPRIRVVRYPDGTFNFSDLLGGGAKAPKTPAPETKGGGAPPINLLISRLALSHGQLFFLDKAIQAKPPFSYQLSDLAVTARNLALDRSFPYSVRARLQGAPLQIEGSINPKGPAGSAQIELSGFDLTAFQPYFREGFPGRLDSLQLDLDLAAEGGLDKASSRGNISLNQIDMTLDAKEDAPVRGATVSLDYDLSSDLKKALISINNAVCDLNGIKVEAGGTIGQYSSSPQIDLEIKLPDTELSGVLAALPESLGKSMAGMRPAGNIRAQATLSGPVADPLKMLRKGMIKLASVQAEVSGVRPELNGEIHLQGDALSSRGLHLKMGGNRADIDLQAANLFGRPIAIATTVTSKRFELDPLLETTSVQAAGKKKPAENREKKEKKTGPFDIPVEAEGRVLVDTALYKGLEVKDFDLAYSLADNILTVEHMRGEIAEGNFSKTARIDLGREGLDYQAEVGVASVTANPFVSALVPQAANTVFGDLSFHLKAQGQGTSVESIRRNLSGQGEMLLLDGKITGAGLVEGLAGFLDLERLRILRFSEIKGRYTVEDGKLRINSGIAGSDVKMHPTGTIGLDGSLDLSLNAGMSPEYASEIDAKGAVTQFLKDEKGWARLPLQVKGSFSEPRFSLDTTAAKKELKRKATEEVRKKLQKEILDKVSPAGQESSGQDEPVKKMLDQTLKGIFGN